MQDAWCTQVVSKQRRRAKQQQQQQQEGSRHDSSSSEDAPPHILGAAEKGGSGGEEEHPGLKPDNGVQRQLRALGPSHIGYTGVPVSAPLAFLLKQGCKCMQQASIIILGDMPGGASAHPGHPQLATEVEYYIAWSLSGFNTM